MTIRLGRSAVMILATLTGILSVQEPATVAEATKAINLETFPVMPGGMSKALDDSPASLTPRVVMHALRSRSRRRRSRSGDGGNCLEDI